MEEVGQVDTAERTLEKVGEMKRYSRKGLIRFFSKMPPDKRPCNRRCPIATYMNLRGKMPNDRAANLDSFLADSIDGYGPWNELTAKEIVELARTIEETHG